MNYSFMTFSCPDKTWDQILAVASRLGYAGVEPRAQSKHHHGVEITADPAARKAIRTQAESAGVAIACLATSCKFADPATAAKNIEEARQLIDLAADIGCPTLRIFGGAFPDTLTRPQAIDSVVHSLRTLAAPAQQRNVTLCLETHDAWCDPAHVADVMRQVNHSHIAVNWDILHPVRAGGSTIPQSYTTLQPWIRHVHLHDSPLTPGKITLVPIGQGKIDHKLAIHLLREGNYAGYLSGEWIPNMMSPEFYATHLEKEICTLKQLENQ